MHRPSAPPLGLLPAQFLARQWQKEPLLLRGALPGIEGSLKPEDLAALACEEGVESRIVRETDTAPRWTVRFGPFTAADFSALPAERWSLLVQEVDRLVPSVAAIVEHFRFLPNWRIDDVMVSYAAPGGSVGPHLDNYDVFLIQGVGRRRWSIGAEPLPAARLLPGLDLEILESFEPEREWTLDPGDLLYLPPRVPHHGVALGPCMTFSVGLRAPSHRELAAACLEWALEAVSATERYSDPDLELQTDPGEITPVVLSRIRRVLVRLVDDEEYTRSWFGRYVTRPRREGAEPSPRPVLSPERVRDLLRRGGSLRRDAIPRFAYSGRSLFVGGREYRLAAGGERAASLLCGAAALDRDGLGDHLDDGELLGLLGRLVGEGYLRPETEEDRPAS